MDQTLEVERHVRFVNDEHEESTRSHWRSRSPPPPYESEDDCLEELLLDLAIAEEGIWKLEFALIEGRANADTANTHGGFPPPPYSSLRHLPSWPRTPSIIELQLDFLIAQERIRTLLWELSGYDTLN